MAKWKERLFRCARCGYRIVRFAREDVLAGNVCWHCEEQQKRGRSAVADLTVPTELLQSYAQALRQPDAVMMLVEDGLVAVDIAAALDELAVLREERRWLTPEDARARLTDEVVEEAIEQAKREMRTGRYPANQYIRLVLRNLLAALFPPEERPHGRSRL